MLRNLSTSHPRIVFLSTNDFAFRNYAMNRKILFVLCGDGRITTSKNLLALIMQMVVNTGMLLNNDDEIPDSDANELN